MGFDDADAGGEDVEARGAEAYNCPFCGEGFDFVGLCCHIDDEHAVEAKRGLIWKQVGLLSYFLPRAETSLSEKDQKERAQRSAFARVLVLSTIFDDDSL
ncbi:hypothetical protein ACQ4PT_043842 [Festuca glaucescens]